MRRALAAAAALAAAFAASAPAAERPLPQGKAIAVYAPLSPTVIMFGDALHLDLTVAVDRRQVDPASIALQPRFTPFDVVRPIRPTHRDEGPITLVSFPLVLRCISYPCVPTGQATLRHLRRARLRYTLRSDPSTPRELRLRLPAVEVLSQINPSLLNAESSVPSQVRITPYTAHLLPLPKPTYRVAPGVLVGGAIAAAAILLAASLVLGLRYLRVLRPRQAPVEDSESALERALAFLVLAQGRGDETATRKALERLGVELAGNGVNGDLAAAAHRLAWAEPSPASEDVERLAEQVRSEVR
jgi:hypothetical protein